MSYYAMQGLGSALALGAIDFDPAKVWADWYDGSPQGTKNNAAGKRSAQALQAALSQLGYGPLTVDGIWGPKSGAAFKLMAQQNGTTTNDIYPTKDGIYKIAELLAGGKTPGPNAAVEFHQVDGQFMTGASATSSSSKASVGMMVGVGIAGALLLGGLVLASKKRDHGYERRA